MTRLLITGARAPAALHLARLLDGAGHHVVMADSLAHTVGAASRACAAFVRLPPANGDQATYGAAMKQAIETHRIDLVVPTCEEVFHLAALWDTAEMGAALYAPALATLAQAHNKFSFIQRAKGLGLGVPQTDLLASDADVARHRATARQLVFKPVWSRFGTDVLIRPQHLTIAPTKLRPWVAQTFVAGTQVCAYAFADKGHVAGMAGYRPTYRAGIGAGIAFLRDDDPAVADYVRRYVAGTGWTGQISFDFIRPEGGPLQAIECNPRATSGLHFFRAPDRFAAAFMGIGTVSPDVTGLQAVKAALAVYHPRSLLGNFWRARDVMAWPDDPRPARQQLWATIELARIAWRHRISLTEATTQDIKWDGR